MIFPGLIKFNNKTKQQHKYNICDWKRFIVCFLSVHNLCLKNGNKKVFMKGEKQLLRDVIGIERLKIH